MSVINNETLIKELNNQINTYKRQNVADENHFQPEYIIMVQK